MNTQNLSTALLRLVGDKRKGYQPKRRHRPELEHVQRINQGHYRFQALVGLGTCHDMWYVAQDTLCQNCRFDFESMKHECFDDNRWVLTASGWNVAAASDPDGFLKREPGREDFVEYRHCGARVYSLDEINAFADIQKIVCKNGQSVPENECIRTKATRDVNPEGGFEEVLNRISKSNLFKGEQFNFTPAEAKLLFELDLARPVSHTLREFKALVTASHGLTTADIKAWGDARHHELSARQLEALGADL